MNNHIHDLDDSIRPRGGVNSARFLARLLDPHGRTKYTTVGLLRELETIIAMKKQQPAVIARARKAIRDVQQETATVTDEVSANRRHRRAVS